MNFIKEESYLLVTDSDNNNEVLKACSKDVSVTAILDHEHFDHIYGLNN